MKSKTLFISYSRKNKEIALELAQRLQEQGVAVWLDLLNLEPGTHWDIAIQNALEEANAVLVLLSPPAVASTYVLSEIDCALEQKKKIVPLLLEECRVPLLLRRVQYIDCNQSLEEGFLVLLEDLKQSREVDTDRLEGTAQAVNPTPQKHLNPDFLEERLISPEEIAKAKSLHLSRVKRLYHLLLGLGILSLGVIGIFMINFFNKNLDFQDTQQQILISVLAILAMLGLFIYRKIGDRDSRIQLIELFELKRNRLERAISKLTEADIENMNSDFIRLASI